MNFVLKCNDGHQRDCSLKRLWSVTVTWRERISERGRESEKLKKKKKKRGEEKGQEERVQNRDKVTERRSVCMCVCGGREREGEPGLVFSL